MPRKAHLGKIAAPKSAAAKSAASTAKAYNPIAHARVGEILRRLDARYPDVQCALHHDSAWELLVATILSAQCTDVRVNMVTPVLFKKYPTVEHFAAVGSRKSNARHPLHWLLPQQVEVGGRSGPQDPATSAEKFPAPWKSC